MTSGKAYSGRLVYNPDTSVHEDDEGHPVVTDDGGKTWRYAAHEKVAGKEGSDASGYELSEPSHLDRYHQGFAQVDSTANELMALQMDHGRKKAEEMMREVSPHHFEVVEGDDHYEKDAKRDGVVTHTRLRFHPDGVAATKTGHTDAWKED